MGFSSCSAWAQPWDLQALELGLSSCGAWAEFPHGLWDLPRPGVEPVSPALAGGFLSSAPPGKSDSLMFIPFSGASMEKAILPHSSTLAWKIP